MKRNIILSLVIAAMLLAAVTESAAQPGANPNASAPKSNKTDVLLIKAQKICPVSGKDLLSGGTPIKAHVGKQFVFISSKECIGKSIAKTTWQKVLANLITAQGVCPVSGQPLKTPSSVVVKGRVIFFNNPPDLGKIQSDPDRYIRTVDSLLERNLQAKRTK